NKIYSAIGPELRDNPENRWASAIDGAYQQAIWVPRARPGRHDPRQAPYGAMMCAENVTQFLANLAVGGFDELPDSDYGLSDSDYFAPLKKAECAERAIHCNLLRDIFGNPFRPLPPRPEAIAPLAEQIYAGAWDQMPLLGEWLQEHGYWSEGEHCLDPKNHHVKGCWVLDWVPGREGAACIRAAGNPVITSSVKLLMSSPS